MLTADLIDLLDVADRGLDVALDTIATSRGPGHLTGKGDRDYASQLDYDVEHAVRAHLQKVTPEIGFVGEEEGAASGPRHLRWVLDPIDGTVNFVHGLPLYAVSLSLVTEDQPILGVIAMPVSGARYAAAAGHGAFRNRQRLASPPPPKSLADAVVAVGDYAVGNNAAAKNEARLSVTARLAGSALRLRMLGSASVDLAWLAEGHLDATVTLSNNIWDMTAGVVIAREAGRRVVEATGHDYTLQAKSTIAAHPDLLPELLDHLS